MKDNNDKGASTDEYKWYSTAIKSTNFKDIAGILVKQENAEEWLAEIRYNWKNIKNRKMERNE